MNASAGRNSNSPPGLRSMSRKNWGHFRPLGSVEVPIIRRKLMLEPRRLVREEVILPTRESVIGLAHEDGEVAPGLERQPELLPDVELQVEVDPLAARAGGVVHALRQVRVTTDRVPELLRGVGGLELDAVGR